jgi:hypothetical protein
VGGYRRRQKGGDELQDAAFFDARNHAGLSARRRALDAALADMLGWLDGALGGGCVAVGLLVVVMVAKVEAVVLLIVNPPPPHTHKNHSRRPGRDL